jgi:hypothetical protein
MRFSQELSDNNFDERVSVSSADAASHPPTRVKWALAGQNGLGLA